MFYRRKILLAIIEVFGNRISKLEIQKYLFLFTRLQKEPVYDFIPYKYGCYSFTVKNYLENLKKKGFIKFTEDVIQKINETCFITIIKIIDLHDIKKIFNQYAKFKNTNNLIRYVYKRAPFYAVNSLVKKQYLNEEELKIVKKSKPVYKKKSLCTIGSEGVSIESYINKLLRYDIRCLVDVRKNPHSMKFGFSGKRLKFICEETGIRYVSIRELGIDSDKRKALETQKDYDMLFEKYKVENLVNTIDSQKQVLELLDTYKRIALTCFEKDINRCHRKVLADFLLEKYNPVECIKHI